MINLKENKLRAKLVKIDSIVGDMEEIKNRGDAIYCDECCFLLTRINSFLGEKTSDFMRKNFHALK